MLYHVPKPFYRKPRQAWYVQLGGKQISLGKDRTEAFKRYYGIMANPPEERLAKASSGSRMLLADLLVTFLSGCSSIDQRKATRGISTDFSGSSSASLA